MSECPKRGEPEGYLGADTVTAVPFRSPSPSSGSAFSNDSGAPQKIRTSDLRLRRPSLYPAELVAQSMISATYICSARVLTRISA